MRGSAYCTANSYKLLELNEEFKKKYPTKLYQEALHCPLKEGEDVFFFSYGCIVFWNVPEAKEKEIIQSLLPYQVHPLSKNEFDEFIFDYGLTVKIFQDEVTLEDPKDALSKLVVSYGLSQSVKLLVYESRAEHAIQSTSLMIQSLATKGRVSLSRRQIGRKIGELFLERSSINLQSAFLDTPEFFWDYSEYEPVYQMVVKDFDIRSRTQSLNRKLEIIHELFQILGDEINHRNSAMLEWIIIILILFEVVMGVTKLLFP
jgi:uncharacterized Rmd1/YagE family protein